MKELNATNARQGRTTNTMPVILGISTILAIAALGIVMGAF